MKMRFASGRPPARAKGLLSPIRSTSFGRVDPVWADNHVVAGLSSGEGLIWAVRDQIEKQEPIRDKTKTITGYQSVIADHGRR